MWPRIKIIISILLLKPLLDPTYTHARHTQKPTTPELQNAYTTIKHTMAKPTEQQLQQEVEHFNNAINNYRQILLIKKYKQQGNRPAHNLTLQEIEACQQHQWRELYHKIPTLYMLELQDLLTQKHIQPCSNY